MIIVRQSYGRLCNQIFLQAHLMAFAIEHGIALANPCLGQYSYVKFFQGTLGNALCCYPSIYPHLPAYPLARRTYFKAANLLYSVSMRLNTEVSGISRIILDHLRFKLYPEYPEYSSPNLINGLSKLEDKICLFEGWHFRCFELLRKHGEKIRAFFSPIPAIQKQVDQFHEQLVKFEYRVGVHIRHEDYKNTDYFFTLETYKHWIEMVRATANGRICFVISSNTTEDLTSLLQDDVFLCPGDSIVDLYCLAACDLIMGPISTFNRWAAFYGNAKHLTLIKESQKISFADFRDFKVRDNTVKLQHLTSHELDLLDCGCVV